MPKPRKAASQRAHADNFVSQIETHLNEIVGEQCSWAGLRDLLRDLDAITAKAQNSPPDGESDGSIDSDHWARLRDVQRATLHLIVAVQAWKEFDSRATS